MTVSEKKEQVRANLMVDKELWERFKAIAKSNDETATQLLRKYVKKYVSDNAQLTIHS